LPARTAALAQLPALERVNAEEAEVEALIAIDLR
jgi:hypothetical protein